MRKRTILFLQAPPSPFARELADALEARGHGTLRINLSAGDWLYWRRPGAWNYRGSLAGWGAFLQRFLDEHGVTDILYYADRFPYHRIAAALARRNGIAAYAYEFGYLRPDWITFERNGMSAHSHVPADPAEIRRLGAALPEPDLAIRFPHGFGIEAFNEVLYNLTTVFLAGLYPRYDGDKIYKSLRNYLGYVPRLAAAPWNERRAQRLIGALRSRRAHVFLVPLQMQSDYQLRANARFAHQAAFIDEVLRSFARAAMPDAELIFKVHPLDNGLESWPRQVRACARAAGIEARVHVIDGGCLATLIGFIKGMVVINSTCGLQALLAGCPVKALGIALYDMAGLTHQGALDDFWQAPQPPDPVLVQAFVRVLAASVQVKGSFYNRAGRACAIAAMIERIEQGTVNGAGAFVTPPPRLERARAEGIPFSGWDDGEDASPLPAGERKDAIAAGPGLPAT